MRRHLWLVGLGLFAACSTTPPDNTPIENFTRIRVAPEAFLGEVPCAADGGMEVYQATLLDVTDGLDDAFALPSSDLTPCTAAVEFGFVEPGRRYIAEVRGYDRSDLEAGAPGSALVRDEEGTLAEPRWETTCWGADGVTPEDLGIGGAAPESGIGGAAPESGIGGAGGSGFELGVESFSKTVVTVRGCEALTDSGSEGTAQVSISIDSSLVDLTCGDDPGEVARFDVAGQDETAEEPVTEETGGAGGGASQPVEPQVPSGQRCEDALIVKDVPAGEPYVVTIEGTEAATGEVIWTTECRANPVAGLTVAATCEPARMLESN